MKSKGEDQVAKALPGKRGSVRPGLYFCLSIFAVLISIFSIVSHSCLSRFSGVREVPSLSLGCLDFARSCTFMVRKQVHLQLNDDNSIRQQAARQKKKRKFKAKGK